MEHTAFRLILENEESIKPPEFQWSCFNDFIVLKKVGMKCKPFEAAWVKDVRMVTVATNEVSVPLEKTYLWKKVKV